MRPRKLYHSIATNLRKARIRTVSSIVTYALYVVQCQKLGVYGDIYHFGGAKIAHQQICPTLGTGYPCIVLNPVFSFVEHGNLAVRTREDQLYLRHLLEAFCTVLVHVQGRYYVYNH
jgi:hypothetical protein